MSNPPNESTRFVTCPCQLCNGKIEFDARDFSQDETRSAECPHCHSETVIFVPTGAKPPPLPPAARTQSVKGIVLDFSIQANAGVISGDDGQRYSFQGADWQEGLNYPNKGARIDFQPMNGVATEIYLIADNRSLKPVSSIANAHLALRILRKNGTVTFQSPENGFKEYVSSAPILVLFFGCFYFAVKGIWTHAVAGLIAALITCGFSWLVYPFFANEIMINHYLRKGWVLNEDEVSSLPPIELSKAGSTEYNTKFERWLIVGFAIIVLILIIGGMFAQFRSK